MSQQQTAIWLKSIEVLRASRNEAAVPVLITLTAAQVILTAIMVLMLV